MRAAERLQSDEEAAVRAAAAGLGAARGELPAWVSGCSGPRSAVITGGKGSGEAPPRGRAGSPHRAPQPPRWDLRGLGSADPPVGPPGLGAACSPGTA